MGDVIDKIAWIHTKDGKVLSTLSRGKDVFYIPGGKREENETDEQTLVREIKEELDVDISGWKKAPSGEGVNLEDATACQNLLVQDVRRSVLRFVEKFNANF